MTHVAEPLRLGGRFAGVDLDELVDGGWCEPGSTGECSGSWSRPRSA